MQTVIIAENILEMLRPFVEKTIVYITNLISIKGNLGYELPYKRFLLRLSYNELRTLLPI
jgi:hypothetical protein